MIIGSSKMERDEIGLPIEIAITDALDEFVAKYPNPNGYSRKVHKCRIPESPTLIAMLTIFDKSEVIRVYEFHIRENFG